MSETVMTGTNQEMLSGIRAIVQSFFQESAKQIQGQYAKLQEKMDENTAAVQSLETTIKGAAGALAASINQLASGTGNSSQNQVSIPQSNLMQIQAMLKASLEQAAKELVSSNNEMQKQLQAECTHIMQTGTEQLNSHVKQLTDKMHREMESILKNNAENMEDSVRVQSEKLASNLNGYAADLSKRFEEALERTQREAVVRQKQLIESMEKLSEENHAFMEGAGSVLSKLEGTVSEMQVNQAQFLQDQKSLNQAQTNQITASFAEQSQVLAKQLDGYALKLTERNTAALQDVQKDNNLKLQELAEKINQTETQMQTILEAADSRLDVLYKIADKAASDQRQYLDQLGKNQAEYMKQLIERLEQQSETLSQQLERYGKEMTERNKEALMEVQRENNLELQALSKNLNSLTETVQKNITATWKQISELDKQVKMIIAGIKEHLDASASNFDQMLSERIDELNKRLIENSRQNAKLYLEAMEQYRDTFIKENAQAIHSAQKELQQQFVDTQTAMKNLMEQIADVIGSVEETVEQMKQTNQEGIDQIQTVQSGMASDLKDIFKNMKKKMDDFIGEMGENLKKLEGKMSEATEQVKQNSENYMTAIQAIQDNQTRMGKLSGEDAKILKELMSRIGT